MTGIIVALAIAALMGFASAATAWIGLIGTVVLLYFAPLTLLPLLLLSATIFHFAHKL